MVSCKQQEALDTKDGTCRLYPGSGGFTNVLYKYSNNLTLWIHPAACPSQVHVNFMYGTLTAGCYWTSIYGFMGTSKEISQTYGSLVLYSNWCPIGTTSYNSLKRTCEFGCPPETPLRNQMSGECMKCPTGLKYVVAKNLCEDECPEEFPFQVSNLCFSCPHGYAYNYGCYRECPTEAPYIDVAKSATMCTNYCKSFADHNKKCVEDCPGYGFHVISESTGVKECVSKCPSEKPRSDANRLCYKP